MPYEDIVFVQRPTEYTSHYVDVLPLTDVADQLSAALRANQPITLTGEASQGSGVDVTGQADEPTPTATPDAEGATPSPSDSTVAQTRVDLPSETP